MVKRYDFIERTLYIIRKELSEKLPVEDTLEEMNQQTKKIIKKIYK